MYLFQIGRNSLFFYSFRHPFIRQGINNHAVNGVVINCKSRLWINFLNPYIIATAVGLYSFIYFSIQPLNSESPQLRNQGIVRPFKFRIAACGNYSRNLGSLEILNLQLDDAQVAVRINEA